MLKNFTQLLILLVVTNLSFSQQKLEYKMHTGDSFTISQEAKQEITQKFNGVEQIIYNDLVGDMFFKVIMVDSDYITFEMSFTEMKMLMTSPTMGEMMRMDSTSENEDIMTKMIKGILNHPIIIKMKKNGKIESVTGGEELIMNMFASAGITEPEIIESAKGQMEKQFGTTALTNSFEQITYIFSDKPVSLNDSWNNEYTGDLNVLNTWTLKTIDDSTFHILGDATIVMTTKSQSISMALEGTQTTSAKGNTKTGLITELSVSSESKGNSEMTGLTIPTTIKSTITYKISQ